MIPKKKFIIIKPESTDKIGSGLLYSHLPISSAYGEVVAVSSEGCEGMSIGDRVKYNLYAGKPLEEGLIAIRATDVYFVCTEGKKLIQNRILVEYDESYKSLPSGIVLVQNNQPHLVWGKVGAVGIECTEVKQGDEVLFPYGVSVKEEHEGVKLLLIRETDVYAAKESN